MKTLNYFKIKYMNKIILTLITITSLFSCTDNDRTKYFGGTEIIKLKKNEIVIGVTWKKSEMWICTRDTISDFTYFRERSNFGVLEGTVILK